VRVQIPAARADQLDRALHAGIARHHGATRPNPMGSSASTPGSTAERRKLLEAYYADAISIDILRTEQQRLGREFQAIDDRLAALDAGLEDWAPILRTAYRFAANCAAAYRGADPQTRNVLNRAVIQRIEARNRHVIGAGFQPPSTASWAGQGGDTAIRWPRVARVRTPRHWSRGRR